MERNYMTKLAILFHQERKMKKKTIKQVSEEIEISAQSISKFENGITAMTPENLKKYADCLDVEIKVKLKPKK